jgi:O-antigen ligase
VLAVGAAQAVLGLLQAASGSDLGLGGLEFPGPLYEFGSSSAGRGGFGHPYHLAAFLLVAVGAGLIGVRRSPRPAPWLVGLALCAGGIGVTYGRAALLGLLSAVAVAAVTAVRRREATWALAAVVLVAGLTLTAGTMGDGWRARAANSRNAETADSDRGERLAEATRLVERSPVVGVGPGRYVLALRDVRHADLLPAHNAIFHEAAEGGILAGLLTTAAVLTLLVRGLRGGAEALVACLPTVPFLLFDAYPYTFPAGLAMAGIWLGLVHVACGPPSGSASGAPSEPDEVPGPTEAAPHARASAAGADAS